MEQEKTAKVSFRAPEGVFGHFAFFLMDREIRQMMDLFPRRCLCSVTVQASEKDPSQSQQDRWQKMLDRKKLRGNEVASGTDSGSNGAESQRSQELNNTTNNTPALEEATVVEETFIVCNDREKVYLIEEALEARDPATPVPRRDPLALFPLDTIHNGRKQPTAHAINELTSTPSFLHLVIGYHTGDIARFDPISKDKMFFNKEIQVTKAPVTELLWRPKSPQYFVALHTDGLLYGYDEKRGELSTDLPKPRIHRRDLDVTVDLSPTGNPVSRWLIGQRGISACAFSPDGTLLATVGADGILRIFNFDSQSLIVGFRSYYGGLRCVCWTPDGKFVVTGGEDDMVTIFDWHQHTVIARCVGHDSWVVAVKIDPYMCDDIAHRIVSIGMDMKMIFWDFSLDALIPAKVMVGEPRSATASVLLPAPPRSHVASMQPVATVIAHNDPLSHVTFTKHCIFTSAIDEVYCWRRPARVFASKDESVAPVLSSSPLASPTAGAATPHALQSTFTSPKPHTPQHRPTTTPQSHLQNSTTPTQSAKPTTPTSS
eukprot:c2967_g1_i1.p1 GENE.c2967_g1_i1~~c2967_g1_i1.p1  ORF type:complete len:543 (+),score=160.25 c2967_g1_i1:60-1688(+)